MAASLYSKKKFVLTNTLTGKREEFKPKHAPRVLFYSCGPTVYGLLHIGNARALIVADLIYRFLKHIGYDVNFVRNYTDVDDKIILRAREEKTSPEKVSEKYIQACEEDIKNLKLLSPTKTVKVTESMGEITALIQRIIDRGFAYVVQGEVLFSVRAFKEYGKLSGKNVDDLQAGARIEVDPKKKDPMDFSLWKPHKMGEPFWESPWGKGRPGWHIECSAMALRWLGDSLDLHHGGQDLIFPHHENEIAQSEAATGHEFCGHWIHHAFLTAGNEKMSKSLGNILTIQEFLKIYGAEILKYIYLSTHFRSSVPYTQEMLSQALSELERVYFAKKWALEASQKPVSSDGKGKPWIGMLGKSQQTFEKMEDELFQDYNTPGALGHLFSLIREINRTEQEVGGKPGSPAPQSAERQEIAREFLRLIDRQLNPLLNVFGETPEAMLKHIEEIRRGQSSRTVDADAIQVLIDERQAARGKKDFKRADEIRKQLLEQGIELIDSPQGTTWKAK